MAEAILRMVRASPRRLRARLCQAGSRARCAADDVAQDVGEGKQRKQPPQAEAGAAASSGPHRTRDRGAEPALVVQFTPKGNGTRCQTEPYPRLLTQQKYPP